MADFEDAVQAAAAAAAGLDASVLVARIRRERGQETERLGEKEIKRREPKQLRMEF